MVYSCNTVELKKAMVENDITTITKLSNMTGVDRNTLGKILNKKILPSSQTMYKIAQALDLQPHRAGIIFFYRKLT